MYQQCFQHGCYATIIVEHDGTGCIEHLKVDIITGKVDGVGILKYDVTQITEQCHLIVADVSIYFQTKLMVFTLVVKLVDQFALVFCLILDPLVRRRAC